MEHLSILPDVTAQSSASWAMEVSQLAEDAWGKLAVIAGVPNATMTGNAGVALILELEDGKRVAGTTTLALLEGAVRGLRARHPERPA